MDKFKIKILAPVVLLILVMCICATSMGCNLTKPFNASQALSDKVDEKNAKTTKVDFFIEAIKNAISIRNEKVDYEVSNYDGYYNAVKNAVENKKDKISIRVSNFNFDTYGIDVISKVSENIDPSINFSGASYNVKLGIKKGIVIFDFTYGKGPLNRNLSPLKSVIEVNSNDELYSQFKKAMYNYNEKVSYKIPNGVEFDDNIISKIIEEDPNICYSASKGISESSSILSSKNSNILTVSINYNYDAAKLRYMRNESIANAKNIIANIIEPSMTELQKEQAIHDYIITRTKYGGEDLIKAHSEYGVLVEGVGVCDSYAKAMFRLLNMVNVKCIFVKGTSSGKAHAWNMVNIDGKWYHLDATFDDPVGGNPDRKYFNISDDLISKDHEWDRAKYPKTN